MRAEKWLQCLCTSTNNPPIPDGKSIYDEQIQLDIVRTFPENKWFNDHHETLRNILNAFCIVNEGLGYPQGLNFLVFPVRREILRVILLMTYFPFSFFHG